MYFHIIQFHEINVLYHSTQLTSIDHLPQPMEVTDQHAKAPRLIKNSQFYTSSKESFQSGVVSNEIDFIIH